MNCFVGILLVSVLVPSVICAPSAENGIDSSFVAEEDDYHPQTANYAAPPIGPAHEQSKEYWQRTGQEILRKQLEKDKLNKNVAKNIIMFIGDGMSIPTQMATRVHLGGENVELSFEKFPYSGLTKTYCVNFQVPDSACTATALLTGIKTNSVVIGVSAAVTRHDCAAAAVEENRVDTIFKWAQDEGMSTGVVSTTRVTHATPAAVYAKTPGRTFERDTNTPAGCEEISHQLIYSEIGSRLNVVLGGGSREFLPITYTDNTGQQGARTDNRNLVNEWLLERNKVGRAVYVNEKNTLFQVNAENTDYLFGLFHSYHMNFGKFANTAYEPTLTEMTSKALEVLKKNPKGYLLLVESGRIDHGHHGTWARLAIDETIEFDNTVRNITSQINKEDTLVIVAADHSHTMSVGAYPERGANIFGKNDVSDVDYMPFFTLSYAQGPGHAEHFHPTESGRLDPTGMNYSDPNFRYPAAVPMTSQTHGGDDVGVFAQGPWSHLFTGVFEQHFVAHALMYAACLGPPEYHRPDICADFNRNRGEPIRFGGITLIILPVLTIVRRFYMM